jgi:hypothetical protein
VPEAAAEEPEPETEAGAVDEAPAEPVAEEET